MSHAPRPPISPEELERTVTAIANNLNSLHYDASMHDEDVSNDNPVVRDLGGVDLGALRASGRSSGSIWPLEKRAPVQRNVDFAAQEQCFVHVALVASILLLRAFLDNPVASIWLP